MRKYLLAVLMGLLIGTVAFAADVRRLISVGDINFGSGVFLDTAGLTLYKVNADNVPFSQDNGVKVGILYYLALAVDNGVSTYCLKSAGDNTFYWGECVYGIVAVANGGTGSDNATGARANLGLNAVDNTADVDKPISTLTQAALDNKQDLSSILSAIAAGTSSTGVTYNDNGTVTWKTLVQFLSLIGITFNASDNTWAFAAEITVPQVNTTCNSADNNCGINDMNNGAPDNTELAAGKTWYQADVELRQQRNADNTATYSYPLWVPAPDNAASPCKAKWMSVADGVFYVCVADNTWQKATIATW